MEKTKKRIIRTFLFSLLAIILVVGSGGGLVNAQEGGGETQQQEFVEAGPSLSADGYIISEAVPRLILVADENPTIQSQNTPFDQNIDLSVKSTSFDITYVNAGGNDYWGEPCLAFPSDAMTAFNYAANIWASTISSDVPITIRACWANLGSSTILGYSGGYDIYRDFPEAPISNTWYASSLANSLHGSDFDNNSFDMHITYNINFSWDFGTDASPLPGSMDFVTVAAHEIAHGLNFSGTAEYSGVSGSVGYLDYPMIYDIFMRDGSGNLLTSYTSPSTALGSILTSNNLWFHGPNAMAANGGNRVKMYAPSTWSEGSSYSHLDYDTFKTTENNMMVYAISYGTANHNPGPVTKGLLKDLGWNLVTEPPTPPTGVVASDGTDSEKVVLSWNPSLYATYYQVFRNTSDTITGATTLSNNYSSSPYNDTTAVLGTTYYYWVKACNVSSCSDYSESDSGWLAAGVLTPPTDLVASDGTDTDKVTISWDPPENATYYQVYRNLIDSTTGATQLVADQSSSPYDDTSGEQGTLYYYWVKGCNESGCSDFSTSDEGWRQGLTAPTGISASDGTFTDKVRIDWNGVGDADYYKIYRSTVNELPDPDFPYVPDNITTRFFDDYSAIQGTDYYYWVMACQNAGNDCSGFSLSDLGYLKGNYEIFLPLLMKNAGTAVDPI